MCRQLVVDTSIQRRNMFIRLAPNARAGLKQNKCNPASRTEGDLAANSRHSRREETVRMHERRALCLQRRRMLMPPRPPIGQTTAFLSARPSQSAHRRPMTLVPASIINHLASPPLPQGLRLASWVANSPQSSSHFPRCHAIMCRASPTRPAVLSSQGPH